MKEYPWQKYGEIDLKESKWVLVRGGIKSVSLIYNKEEEQKFEIGNLEGLPLDDLVDCFRGWVQKVQLLSMNNKNMKET